MKRWQR